MALRFSIIAAMKEIAEEQHVKWSPLTHDLSLHEIGFDSLALAIPVRYPAVGNFVRACENVPA